MKAQLDNILMSSMIMWIDHQLLNKGEAYKNFSSLLYPITNIYNGFYSYGLPFKQIVCDSSVTGAKLLSGVYINGSLANVGNSNLTGINPFQGQVYFNAAQGTATISGNYAVKDFNIYLTSNSEEELLFETQYQTKPKTSQTATGLAIESITYPCIFLKNNGGVNEPFALGGQDDTIIEVRAIVLADSMFHLDAVCSILKDTARCYVPLIYNSTYNNFGSLVSGYYNYNSLIAGINVSNDAFYISEVNVSKIFANIKTNNNQVYPAFVDFTLSNIRYPRA